jgi:hypothetical protein
VQGNIYHVVIAPSSGIDSGNYLSVLYATPQTGCGSFDETKDGYMSVLSSINNGVSWNDMNSQPIYLVQGTSVEGSAYYTATTSSMIYGANYYGESITVSGVPRVVRRVSFYVKANTVAPPPDDHLYVTLQNVTDSLDVETVKMCDKNDITGTHEWYSADFTVPHTLEAGKLYRVFLKSPYSSGSRYYTVYRAEGNPNVGAVPADNYTYDGQNSCYLENTGSGWVTNGRYDTLFKLFSATYNLSGTFTSSVLDAGAPSAFNTVSWTPPVQATGTQLKLQVASSSSELGPWNFSGPDGTASTYYQNAGGESVSSLHSGKRYLRYKLFLSSTDAGSSPVLNSITVSYTARPMPGTALQILCYPVPFSPATGSTSINYLLVKDSKVTVKIFTAMGDLVKQFNFDAGTGGGKGDVNGFNNKVSWDGRNGDGYSLPSGAYIVQVSAEPSDGSAKTTETKKIMIIR